jgi:hypothetical protein
VNNFFIKITVDDLSENDQVNLTVEDFVLRYLYNLTNLKGGIMAKTLEERIQVLEDIEAIKNLKASYCYLADKGITSGDPQQMDPFLDLFADSACTDFGEFGIYRGKEAVSKYFKEGALRHHSYTNHMLHNSIIEVKGNNAKGIWDFHVSFTVRKNNRAGWMQGKYEEEYVKVEGKWKFNLVKISFDYITPFDEGWAKNKMMS